MILDHSVWEPLQSHTIRLGRGLEGQLPLSLLAARHAVDHDVGEAVATPPPASEAKAEELEALEPVDRLPDVLTLQQRFCYRDNYKKVAEDY